MSIDSNGCLIRERRGQIEVVTMNRPQRANALSTELVSGILEVLQDLRFDHECRALVLTGAGLFFCAGADLKEQNRPQQWIWDVRRIMSILETLPQPCIASINGACRGGGTELALACDFRVMSEETTIGMPEIKFGALPFAGGTQRLVKLVGLSHAKELIFSGEPINAQRALEIGLVDRVVPGKCVVEAAFELAETFIRNPPYAVATAKLLTNCAIDVPLERGVILEANLIEGMATPNEREQARREAAESSQVYNRLFLQERG